MHDGNWDQRRLLFESFSGCKWPESTKARQRIEEVLDGVNLRADQWRLN